MVFFPKNRSRNLYMFGYIYELVANTKPMNLTIVDVVREKFCSCKVKQLLVGVGCGSLAKLLIVNE